MHDCYVYILANESHKLYIESEDAMSVEGRRFWILHCVQNDRWGVQNDGKEGGTGMMA